MATATWGHGDDPNQTAARNIAPVMVQGQPGHDISKFQADCTAGLELHHGAVVRNLAGY
jgi:hypothetical protein